MAQASPLLLTVTPKQLGKHLREVRRKKGLSLSEVARGAGLSRRELVAYERGKVAIPESDLWVLAGSCGVDAAELVPQTTVPELAPGPTNMGDTVAQLRRPHDDASLAPYLATLNRLQALGPGKRIPVKARELEEIATALGGAPEAIEARLRGFMQLSPAEAARMRAMILPQDSGRHRPRAIEAAPQFTEMATATAGAVDVFEELARLPEPVPLPDPTGPLPNMLAAQPPPEGAVELVDSGGARVGVAANGFGPTVRTASPAGMSEPAFVDGAAFATSAADAPPIDVANRQSSDAWADWGKVPTAPPIGNGVKRGETVPDDAYTASTATPDAAAFWEPPSWEPPGADGTTGSSAPSSFWEGTDDWEPPTDPEDHAVDPLVDAAIDAPDDAHDTHDPWTSHEWPTDLAGEPEPFETPGWAPDDAWTPQDWSIPTDTAEAPLPSSADDAGPWAHDPDPEAVNTGFYVDWGTPASDDEPPAWQSLIGTDPNDADFVDIDDSMAISNSVAPDFPFAGDFPVEPDVEDPPAGSNDSDDSDDSDDDALAPIMWHAAGYETPTPAPTTAPLVETELATDHQPPYDSDPAPVEQFAVAGVDWQLGNALPLVEVRGAGALVMRRADERWALADLTTPQDCAVEVDVDFRSGPGLGVLFRASVDDAGRMSGYSFDIDPIYDGGGYLVRQWQSDRELWNPIARVGAPDPASMCGPLTVRLVLEGDHLAASVNGVEVLTVESLAQASAERGREAADGDRVGVQAWSSSDLVIETLRIADRRTPSLSSSAGDPRD